MRRWIDVDYQCYNSNKITNTQTAASSLYSLSAQHHHLSSGPWISTVAEAGTGKCLAQQLSVDVAVYQSTITVY